MADQDTLLFTDRAGLAQGGVLLYLASGALAEPGTPPAILRVPRAEALAAGEAELQLLEGQRYEYECSDPAWRLALKGLEAQGVVRPSRLAGRQHSGLLVPGLATGLVQLVLEDAAGQALAWPGWRCARASSTTRPTTG